jgi:RNA polymerase sigma factor for flagellar operon FliA
VTLTRLSPEQRLRVERGKPLVDKLARMLARRLARITEDELRSAGYEALVKCGLRYDPTQAASFRTYAFHRVRGAMIDAARRSVPGLRQRGRALRAMQASQALLEQVEQRELPGGPDPRTLAERVAAAADLVAQTTAAVVLSRLSTPDPEEVADEAVGEPEEVLHDTRLREHLRSTLERCCTEDERSMIVAIYEEGLTMTELGERLGRNKSTISRRHAALLKRIAVELRIDGAPG